MWTVQINNYVDPITSITTPGWLIVSQHSNQADANAQMQIYITNNGVSSANIKVVAPT